MGAANILADSLLHVNLLQCPGQLFKQPVNVAGTLGRRLQEWHVVLLRKLLTKLRIDLSVGAIVLVPDEDLVNGLTGIAVYF